MAARTRCSIRQEQRPGVPANDKLTFGSGARYTEARLMNSADYKFQLKSRIKETRTRPVCRNYARDSKMYSLILDIAQPINSCPCLFRSMPAWELEDVEDEEVSLERDGKVLRDFNAVLTLNRYK